MCVVNLLIINSLCFILFTSAIWLFFQTIFVPLMAFVMRILSFTATLFLMLFSFACKPSSNTQLLKDIEQIIQSAPDIALIKLNNVSFDDLTKPKDAGLYSLLFSIALDKD